MCDVIVLDIAARAERAVARPRENRDAQSRVIAKLAPDIREHPVGLEVTGVQPLRPINRHISDRPFFLEQYFHRDLSPAPLGPNCTSPTTAEHCTPAHIGHRYRVTYLRRTR